ncbi:MAG: type IV pilus modification protein PilV [Burkholderiales bacterium]|nr:type IV pilus modification protein PilV [Burkholderiales bacterium]
MTLIEVLVSILILGLALISLAGLQSYTVKYQLGSANRAVLSMLVSDYAERVRANLDAAPKKVAAGSSTSKYLYAADWATQADAPVASSTDCAATVCTAPDLLAEWDMAQWRQRVRDELPRGSVQVTGTVADGLTVTLMWQDNEFGAKSLVCAPGQSPVDARQCCPVELSAGVRCANFLISP